MQNAFLTAYQILVGQLDWIEQVIGALLMLLLVGLGLAVRWHKRQREANKPGMASTWFISLCGLIGFLAVGGAAYGLGLRSATMSAAPKVDASRHTIIKDIKVDGMLTPPGGLTISGEVAEHISKARLVLEVKAWAMGRWIDRFRVELPPLTEKLKGDRITVPITSYLDKENPQNPQRYFWGDPKENYPVYYGPMLVRVFITNSKEDQSPYEFLFFRAGDTASQTGGATTPHTSYLIQGADLNLGKQWETK